MITFQLPVNYTRHTSKQLRFHPNKISTDLLNATLSWVFQASAPNFHILQGFCFSGCVKFICGELDSQMGQMEITNWSDELA